MCDAVGGSSEGAPGLILAAFGLTEKIGITDETFKTVVNCIGTMLQASPVRRIRSGGALIMPRRSGEAVPGADGGGSADHAAGSRSRWAPSAGRPGPTEADPVPYIEGIP